MSTSWAFEPDKRRADRLDARMRNSLADSLAHIAERSCGILRFDDSALTSLVAKLRDNCRFPPLTFALYYDLVDAINEDHLVDAEGIFAELCQQTPVSETLTIRPLDTGIMGASAVDRYCRMMDTDAVTHYQFTTPAPQVVSDFPKRCEKTLSLMARAIPELHGEFVGLVSEIVLATGQSSDSRNFAGASSFLLWGTLFLNPEGEGSSVSLIETLAHESAHSLLFGLMLDSSFVLNPDEERFHSPLRNDPRPMDGIYHATFVVARMHYAMQRLISSGLLDATNTEVARASLNRHQTSFADGLATIKRHGRLTQHGEVIMSSAADYMARAA